MKKLEVMLIPLPAMGHIVAGLEIAKLLVQRDNRLSTTVFIMHPPLDPRSSQFIKSLDASTLPDRMKVIYLPNLDSTSIDFKPRKWIDSLIEGQKPHIKDYVSKLKIQSLLSADSPRSRLAGFIFDSFATGLKDVATEFGVPWYSFFPSGAAFLRCMLHLQFLHDEEGVDLTEFKNSDVELEIPSLVNPLPAKLLPTTWFEKDTNTAFLETTRRLTEAKGVLVNTFLEFESHAINSLSDGKTPLTLYPVGPILKHKRDGRDAAESESELSKNYKDDIMEWLDNQPLTSVMFLCFGSWGSFKEKQVKEIAYALEHSGHRFLWSLRKDPNTGNWEAPSDYENFEEILPEGFFDRTTKIGKVIGWAPQVDILAHQAIGGFASHCGWNSTLESIRFGVPVATWPLYAEQQFNAFQMVVELGLAVEIKMDYRKDFVGEGEVIVSSDDIMKAIKLVMEQDSGRRMKVKEMSQISEKTLTVGGSSHSSLVRFINDMIGNLP